MNVKDAIVLITDANERMGKGFAEEFLKAGAKKIYLGASQPDRVVNLAACHPKIYIPLRLDVTNAAHINNVIKKAPDVNILINSASVRFKGRLFDKNRMQEAWYEMDVNFFAPLAMIRAYASLIKKNGGGVIANISSIAGLVPIPSMPTYSASKAALHFLTLEARMELAEHNIDLIGIYPTLTDADMLHSKTRKMSDAGQIARETIRAIEAGEHSVFPDPYLKDIYAVMQRQKELAVYDTQISTPAAIKAA